MAVAEKVRRANGGEHGAAAVQIARGRLDGLLGYHLRRAEVAAFQSFHAHMDAERVTPAQLGILITIEANPGVNQTRIGKGLGIDRSTLVAMVDGLERRGLLARAPAPNDRRSHALKLTRAGEGFLKHLLAPLERHEREIARRLTPAERKTLIALLRRVAE